MEVMMSSQKTLSFLTITLLLLMPGLSFGQTSLPFQDPALPLGARVSDLVSRMTLKEKIGQMQNHAPAIQRLGITEYDWWSEALHGVARAGFATVFPQAIGMAATWDPDLIHTEAGVISTEARAMHNEALRKNQETSSPGLDFWSPNVNIFRDPRWGRGQETYGEDPFLTSRMGVAFVKGLQGDDPQYFKVIATPKHFAVHSGPEPLRHVFDARTRIRDLYETYLPAFEACITEGGAWSIMGAYNRFDGEPCCASSLLLGDILRGEWKFGGYVVSDCGAISDMYSGHKVARNAAEASARAVKAGCDLTCGDEYEALAEAVAQGLITEKEIDVSVKRLMTARFKLGMFDPPQRVRYAQIPFSENDSPQHDALARKVAQESIVLLKNSHEALPLRKDLSSIAVIGPNADDSDVLLGNYNGTPSHPVTVLQGIRNKVGAGTKVLYARGCEIAEGMEKLEAVPSRCLRNREGTTVRPGLRGEYYANKDLQGTPALIRNDETVDFGWAGGGPAEGFPVDNFSARWTGTLVPEVSARYILGVTADDGFRLYLDSTLFMEDWRTSGAHTVSRTIELTAGREYDVRLEYFENGGDAVARLGWTRPTNLAAEALAIAREADQIIAVMGISPQLEGEEMGIKLKGFSGGDRTDLSLPEPQENLLKALAGLGKPLTLVLMNGSALVVNWANENLSAIVDAWYPGQEGGTAVADVLFGDYTPAGRLPVTFYKSVTDLPPFEDYSMEGRTYRYFRGKPLYPFGYGLSYTQFEYRKAEVTKLIAGSRDTIRVRVTLANTGKFDGDEVIQVYARRTAGGAEEPIRSLKGFARAHLKRGETTIVDIPVAVKDLRVYEEKNKRYGVVPGAYELQIGPSSSDIKLKAQITVTS